MITSWKVKRVVTIVGKQKKEGYSLGSIYKLQEETEESFIGVEDTKEKSDYKLRRDYK